LYCYFGALDVKKDGGNFLENTLIDRQTGGWMYLRRKLADTAPSVFYVMTMAVD
jgi:hypothetical protein